MARLSLRVLGLLAGRCLSIDEHAKFVFDDGLIKLQADESLRLNVKGGANPGDGVILWPCNAHAHESFDLMEGGIKVRYSQLCLNAEGGPNPGARIVTWPCGQDGEKVEHEEFQMGSDGRITLSKHPHLCINVKGSDFNHGGELILWPCGNDEEDAAVAANEEFIYKQEEGLIQLKAKPEFHFNVAGGILDNSSHLNLYTCQGHSHEIFEFVDERVRLRYKPSSCLNAEAGLGAGHRIVAWPCEEEPQDNERFAYDPDRNVIYAVAQPDLVFNVKHANVNAGTDIVLWYIDDKTEL
eukprot:TRINITY_DN90495_c0_g1_i1.p1 TRINITY_DN90495_c0_g1~~TRINITY_DN90495_c0_g1_i1.p1  ORF type:complete len:319 (+),score=66.58 TRINITY_DN90495_c0_g1_i1:71-958(+)